MRIFDLHFGCCETLGNDPLCYISFSTSLRQSKHNSYKSLNLAGNKEVAKQFQLNRDFADRREKVISARTYFYEDEHKCDAHLETFLKCIDAVGGYELCNNQSHTSVLNCECCHLTGYSACYLFLDNAWQWRQTVRFRALFGHLGKNNIFQHCFLLSRLC